MRIVITKNGKILVQELEEEIPSNIKPKIKSFQSSSYSRLPIINTNEELLKKYSNKSKNNEFIINLLHNREISSKRRSYSLIDQKALENFYNRDESKINKSELNQAKKVTLSHTKLNIAQSFLDKYDEYDDNFRKKLNDFNNLFSNNSKQNEEKEITNNNNELKTDNNSKTLTNSNNINILPISPMDSNNVINNINSSTISPNKLKRINIGDIISKKNLFYLRNKISKYNKGSNDVRIPLDKQNLRSFNFRTKYENKQATEDDMDLILNYGINSDKSNIIKYFQQNKNISPHYFENLLKYDETQLYKLNKICEGIFEEKEKENKKKKMKFFGNKNDDKYKIVTNLRDIEKIIKKSDSVINDYSEANKSRQYWKLRACKEKSEKIKKNYWVKYNVDRFLKNKQKNLLNNQPFSTKNADSKKLFASQSSPNVLLGK